jgi:hypothetical protein
MHSHVALPSLLPAVNHSSPATWLSESAENLECLSAASVSMPDMFQMSNDLTNLFEAFGNGDSQLPQARYHFHNEMLPLQESGEISRLFEGLL